MSSIFTEDISVQELQLDYTSTEIFNSKDDANLKFFKKSGIYNSSIDEIKFFTNNIDALIIDNNQTVICNNLKSINSIVTSILSNNTDLNITTSDTNQIIFNIGANEKLRITSSGNVGIGTNNPAEKLDINGNINATEILKGGVNISNVFLTSNSIFIDSKNSINEITIPNVTKINYNSSYYYYVFTNDGNDQTSYNIIFNNSSICDILIVGGGGSGDGGGGGSGELKFFENYSISSGTYNIKVGNGGQFGWDGFSSMFDNYIAKGGYASVSYSIGGNNGNDIFIGGSSASSSEGYATGGGAGAASNGTNGTIGNGGNGGNGSNFTAYFGTSVGDNGFFHQVVQDIIIVFITLVLKVLYIMVVVEEVIQMVTDIMHYHIQEVVEVVVYLVVVVVDQV